jgi:nicotinamide phosphoribosyltransferase
MTVSMLKTDGYKVDHRRQYPTGTTMVYSNWTPRKSRLEGIDKVVFFGLQYFIKKYLIEDFEKNFFGVNSRQVMRQYQRRINNYLGPDNQVGIEHIKDLHDLGYLPIRIKAVKEGTRTPIGVAQMTVQNTIDRFFWLTNYFETIISTTLWMPCTSATIADSYRQILDDWALKTDEKNAGFVDFQGHDFSMRGMAGLEAAIMSGAGHLLSFKGTDTIPAIDFLEEYYNADSDKELIGCSVAATEHSVMCMGTDVGEFETFCKLINETYPKGIVSIVSDTWNLWEVLTSYLPELKDDILARDGKVVIRPDSGDPADILCGTWDQIRDYSKCAWGKQLEDAVREDLFEDHIYDINLEPHECGPDSLNTTIKYKGKYYDVTVGNIEWDRHDKTYYYHDQWGAYRYTFDELEVDPENIGVIELLWNVFGGNTNKQGYKVLDPHIGAIYGDAITRERAIEISKRLEAKGFASTNVVFGIGSYTYQYNTRDTFGFAMKATYGEVESQKMDANGRIEAREIYKDPITDDGTKKSAKGLLMVNQDMTGKIWMKDQCDWIEEESGILEDVFINGRLVREQSLQEIRDRLKVRI